MTFIHAYNSEWPNAFDRLQLALGVHLCESWTIHHVGSTAIPGMPAKNIIDLDIECPQGEMVQVISRLEAIGYDHWGDRGIRGREAFFARSNSVFHDFHPHHLYACEASARELRKHLAFRDYLIATPARAKWLAAQKMAADAAARSWDAYIELKAQAYAIVTSEAIAYIDGLTVGS